MWTRAIDVNEHGAVLHLVFFQKAYLVTTTLYHLYENKSYITLLASAYATASTVPHGRNCYRVVACAPHHGAVRSRIHAIGI